jgi:GNAT superfamily N-acetyltransferase
MYVAPEARGRGCAHLLLDAIADLAMQQQHKRLVLEVVGVPRSGGVSGSRCGSS